MTFRPPATKPARRRSRQTDMRRTFLLNVAFTVCSLAAVALLGGVLFANWYSDHGVPVASVNGQAISKDGIRARAAVNLGRFQRMTVDYGNMRNQGFLTSTDYANLTGNITPSEDASTLNSTALTQLEQELSLQQYADQHGITVSDADVDAQVTKDGTIPEMRHVLIIATEPVPTPPAASPTAAEITAAQTTAQGYLDSIKSGAKKFADVSKVAASLVPYGVSNTGDLGLVSLENSGLDPTLAAQIFALAKVNDVTSVMKGDDGVFRFATVTQIVPANPDPGWADAVSQASNSGDFRSYARALAIKAAVQKSIEGQYVSGPTVNRKVQEIFLSAGLAQSGGGDEVKTKMMMFSPGHDSTSATSLPQTDPAWAAAKARADAAYATLQKDPTQFATLASDTTNNDDPNASSLPGGDYPYVQNTFLTGDASSGAGLGMTAVPAAIFAPNLTPGIMAPILEPSMGYVLVDYQGRRPAPAARIAAAQFALATGADFGKEVAQYSEAPDATSGGDMGWVTRYQLSSDMEDAIFQAPVGGLSRLVSNSTGFYLFKVTAEETRTPDAAQQQKLSKVVFDTWLSNLTSAANVWTDQAGLTALNPASPTP